MPKIRKSPEQVVKDARTAIEHEILMTRTDRGIRQYEIAEQLDLASPSASRLLHNLDSMTANRIRVLVRMLNLNPINLLLWLGYTEQEIKSINKE